MFSFWHCLSYRNIQEELCPIRHCGPLSLSLNGADIVLSFFFPHINIIFVIPSLVSVFYIVILWLWTVSVSTLCLRDVGPCFVCVCVYPLQPHRDLYTSLALSACHCYASFVPLSSCEHVFLPMTVCMSIIRPCVNVCAICAFAYRMHVHAYCVCVGLFCQEPAPLGVCPLCPVLCSVDLGIWLL